VGEQVITLEGANGLLNVGDEIAYPGRRGQKIATIVEIHVIASRYEPKERVRIYVASPGHHYWDSILRNPRNVVKVA
jgi:hypothetical protein